MIRTRHTELRAEMVRNGFDGQALADLLGCSRTTVSSKLCGKSPWTSDEMYFILDIFGIPDSELGRYFPRNGISDPQSYRKLKTDLPQQSLKEIRAI